MTPSTLTCNKTKNSYKLLHKLYGEILQEKVSLYVEMDRGNSAFIITWILPVVIAIQNTPDSFSSQHQQMQNHSCRKKLHKNVNHIILRAPWYWKNYQEEFIETENVASWSTWKERSMIKALAYDITCRIHHSESMILGYPLPFHASHQPKFKWNCWTYRVIDGSAKTRKYVVTWW